MGIYGAMFSAVSGLNAQSQSLGMISDNISNVNTTGYKTSKAAFSTLVTGETLNNYSPGGVRVSTQQEVSRQGLIQSSGNATDLAIQGQGFFVTANSVTPATADDRYYTRAGSFRPDSSGYLRTPTGFYLMGWPTDANGVPTVANPSDVNLLEPVQVNVASGTARATTTLDLGLNLPAAGANFSFAETDAQTGGPFSDGISAIAFSGTVASGDAFRYSYDAATENLTVRDLTTGTSQVVSVTSAIDAVAGVGADLAAGQTASISVANLGVNMTLSFAAGFLRGTDIAVGTLSTAGLAAGTTMTAGTVTLPNSGMNKSTVDALVAAGAYDATTGLLTLPVASTGANEAHFNPAAAIKFSVDGGAVAANISATDLDDGSAHSIGVYVNDGSSDVLVATLDFTALASTGAGAGDVTIDLGTGLFGETATSVGDTETTVAQIYDSLGIAHDVTLTWTKNAANDWTVTAAVAGSATVDEAAVGTGAGYSVNVLFNGDGTPASFDGAATPPDLAIGGWTTGALDSVVALGLGTPGAASGVTQFSSSYSTNFIDQDGAQFGNFFGVTIDEDGIVTATFDNGATLTIYKVPVATFANPDGLTAKTGTAYLESSESGNVMLRDAGSFSAGKIVPSALEASNTDIASEFTTMIITQQAYAANAKVITTADEMLSVLEQIKR